MPALAGLLCLIAYALGYRFYARWLGRSVFRLDPARTTPAHELADGVDYVPTRRSVLLGHHYASIAGLSPMLGPAIAVIWGWLPALLWVVLGTLFIGAVHDFSALVLSMRARGMSIGKVAEGILGRRAKTLFHLIIFFLVALGMGVFVHVIAVLFTANFYPQAVLPTAGLMGIAIAVGLLVRRRPGWLTPLTVGAFALTLGLIVAGLRLPSPGLGAGSWKWLLLGYAFVASVLPVWLLLQPRDYVNSLLLYLGLGASYLGFFVLRPQFAAPALQVDPAGAPPLFPFVFIVIACGAVSGFHGLVSSGTTAKQIDNERDAPLIGYGGMIGESLLGLLAVLACTAGFVDRPSWQAHYADWRSADGLGDKIGAFVDGSAGFVASLGVPQELAASFLALVVVSFALTSLDSATRLLRYNLAEMGEARALRPLQGRATGSAVAVASIAFFAFHEIDGRAAGLALWELFGTTNQVLAGLTLLAVTLWLRQRGRNMWPALLPMLLLLATTLVAMVMKLGDFWAARELPLLAVGAALLVLALWLVAEAVLSLRRPAGGEA